MEYIEGGSLKGYLEKLSKMGEKHVPVKRALSIARDVAGALLELHSKLIIHRDIKSENILIDLDIKRTDGTPVVKICDFDEALSLQSTSQTFCNHHYLVLVLEHVNGWRWRCCRLCILGADMGCALLYQEEVDIWSFGCLVLELLMLQIHYASFPSAEMKHLLNVF
ncbi:uncharacterized protein [Aristolochia californica]|uniref:uncharacterized protein n=1 Tax=Aristolochia californica TaxID=171875 RepID=UPI0035E37D02